MYLLYFVLFLGLTQVLAIERFTIKRGTKLVSPGWTFAGIV